jgi:hypothetical protein
MHLCGSRTSRTGRQRMMFSMKHIRRSRRRAFRFSYPLPPFEIKKGAASLACPASRKRTHGGRRRSSVWYSTHVRQPPRAGLAFPRRLRTSRSLTPFHACPFVSPPILVASSAEQRRVHFGFHGVQRLGEVAAGLSGSRFTCSGTFWIRRRTCPDTACRISGSVSSLAAEHHQRAGAQCHVSSTATVVRSLVNARSGCGQVPQHARADGEITDPCAQMVCHQCAFVRGVVMLSSTHAVMNSRDTASSRRSKVVSS